MLLAGLTRSASVSMVWASSPGALDLRDNRVRIGPVYGSARGDRAMHFNSAARIGHR